MDRNRIEVYAQGGQRLVRAMSGLTREQWLAVPVPGTWSLQQIAIHMMDSDLIGTDRMKRIAAMEKPLLIGYDETAFSLLPGTNDLDALEACKIFDMNRKMWATMLRQLPDASFERIGIHSEAGAVTLGKMIDKYIDHLEGHLKHVLHKRTLLGNPITLD